MTTQQQVAEWMETRPVVRLAINGEIVELTGDDRIPFFEQAAADLEAQKPAIEEAKMATIKAAAMVAPYEVLPEGFFLATAESDQNAFTRLLQLLGTAQAPDEMPVTIADADGQKHVVTVARLKQILVGYGFEIHSRWAS
jgi:hypothetical protein